ncbi:hypothetical protein V5F49_13110 [Xanthobacter sp. V3C-3]|uniref:hypothetical protein n=1 Tax=Xanthobacter lutulentifluminis TaxID=3119935 RepID=UPI0037284C1D
MRKTVFFIALASAVLTLPGISLADETETAVNRETQRVARGEISAPLHAPAAIGYANAGHGAGHFQGAGRPEGVSEADAALFALGDRGLGNN